LRGRTYALPQDIKDLANDVLRHRLVLTYQALAEEISPDVIIDAVLAKVPAPKIELARDSA
jgi:MoxR-like ATPase